MSRNRITANDRRSNNVLSALVYEVCSHISSARALTVWTLFHNKEWDQLVSLECNPRWYDPNTPDRFAMDYLLTEMLSKFPFETSVDRSVLALSKFLEYEEEMSAWSVPKVRDRALSSVTTDAVISTASRKIAKVLGPFNWDHVELRCAFGPGATVSLPRSAGDTFYKFGNKKPTVTKGALALAAIAVSRVPRWAEYLTGTAEPLLLDVFYTLSQNVVAGNKVITVPKNAKTDRVIAIEPDLNMYLQKGIGSMIRKSLRRVGVDLNDQTINQSLASDLSLATIDLKSASDRINLKLVEALLPSDWYEAICLTRSPRGSLPDGTKVTYHKVSSSGNGFTFELESLIFWAICSSVIDLSRVPDRRLGIYGDDIIVSVSVAPTIMGFLPLFGFEPNMKKSHIDGVFRESCGKHYFQKVDVTPFYVRKDVDSPVKLIDLLNRIRNYAKLSYGLDGRFKSVYMKGISLLPEKMRRPTCPPSISVGLHGDFDACRPTYCRKLHSYKWSGWMDRTVHQDAGGVPYLLRQLYSAERSVVRDSPSGVQHRKEGYRPVRGYTTQWESYGPWLEP